jgi:hypothetical protein
MTILSLNPCGDDSSNQCIYSNQCKELRNPVCTLTMATAAADQLYNKKELRIREFLGRYCVGREFVDPEQGTWNHQKIIEEDVNPLAGIIEERAVRIVSLIEQ